MAAITVERIVVLTTLEEKKEITAKAKKMNLPVSEFMRRGAAAYEAEEINEALALLADNAKAAADRASASIDEVLAFVNASNKRIEKMEMEATKMAQQGG